MIYLDNAATTPLDGCVLEEMLPYLRENYGNSQSQHSLGRASANALVRARDFFAQALGCRSEEIYFTSGGTECGNTALKGACSARGKGHIIVSAIEHPSLIESAKDMLAHGFEVTFVNPDKDGRVQPAEIERAMRQDTFFCAVASANNETGVIQPAREIGEICRKQGVFYYADCVQSAGTQKLSCDFCDGLGISAHKFYGPKGAGVLYIKSSGKISRLISGGMQERGLRGGTVNVAAAVGMAKAYENALLNLEKNRAYISGLKNSFVKRVLAEIDGAYLNGGGEILPSHANISFDGCDGENILFALDLKGIAVSTGSACSAGAVNPSHVLTAMGLPYERVKSAVRFSFGKYNTAEEVNKTVKALKEIISKIRSVNGRNAP